MAEHGIWLGTQRARRRLCQELASRGDGGRASPAGRRPSARLVWRPRLGLRKLGLPAPSHLPARPAARLASCAPGTTPGRGPFLCSSSSKRWDGKICSTPRPPAPLLSRPRWRVKAKGPSPRSGQHAGLHVSAEGPSLTLVLPVPAVKWGSSHLLGVRTGDVRRATPGRGSAAGVL